MDIPGGKKQHFRHLLYFAFRRGQKATEAARDICAVYGEDAITARTARNWFAKFKNGNFDLDDSLRSGRPSDFDEDSLKALLKEDGRRSSRELAEKMYCDQKAILNHLHSMGFAEKHPASRQRTASHSKHRQSRPPRARLGSPSAPTVLSGPCANRLSPFPLAVEPNARCYLRQQRGPRKLAQQLLRVQARRFLAKRY
ncbi:hypothetical protein RB195_014877 [Necator americanus]|uniref:Mos1 transposase HTH domain-containing protein n=1 Tax=Necator americanus TaxID=51031 RepID=A0ABR1E2F5_NECAM